jgi:hypothetical protein
LNANHEVQRMIEFDKCDWEKSLITSPAKTTTNSAASHNGQQVFPPTALTCI